MAQIGGLSSKMAGNGLWWPLGAHWPASMGIAAYLGVSGVVGHSAQRAARSAHCAPQATRPAGERGEVAGRLPPQP